ncbi:MAG: alpha/beta hydrolase [Acidobacteria bacterium]|nr:alpha/beta hydrolase [Acidobacteriota bacterium]
MGGFLQEAQDRQYISSNFKNAAFAEVHGSGHFPHFEQAAQVNATIEGFVERLT